MTINENGIHLEEKSIGPEKTPVNLAVELFLKRTFDIFAALLGIVILCPLFLLVAIIIKRDSDGPILFKGRRMGRYGKEFNILKFRTMHHSPESFAGELITARGDSRITALGKQLRDTKINELPQLWNVLIGEMSLVGPRPEDPELVKHWSEDARHEILSMRPGITSPASVAYHNEEKRLSVSNAMNDYIKIIAPDKMRLDQLYVRHHSFITDIDILFWTLVIILPHFKNSKILEGWMLNGPISRFIRRYIHWSVIDFLIALLAMAFIGFIWEGREISSDRLVFEALVGATYFTLLFSIVNLLLGLKSVSWRHAGFREFLKLLSSGAITVAVAIYFDSFINLESPSNNNYVIVSTLATIWVCIVLRFRLKLITGAAARWITVRKRGYGAGKRLLLIGAGEGSSFALNLLKQENYSYEYDIIGIIDDDPNLQGLSFDGYKVLGTSSDLIEIISKYDIEILFLSITKISLQNKERILKLCAQSGLPLLILSDILNLVNDYLSMNTSPNNLSSTIYNPSHISNRMVNFYSKIKQPLK